MTGPVLESNMQTPQLLTPKVAEKMSEKMRNLLKCMEKKLDFFLQFLP